MGKKLIINLYIRNIINIDLMDNNLSTKISITQNNNYEIKYLYSRPNGLVGIGKRITVTISAHKFGDKQVDLVSNPVIIFELGETDLEFVPERIFSNIQFEIGGSRIDIIWINHITVLQKKYNLEVKQIGSKVFFPLPIYCLLKSNGIIISKCNHLELRLCLQFTNEPCIGSIQDMCLRTDLVILQKQPVWKNVCESVLSELLVNSINSDRMKKYIEKKPYGDFESKQITKIKQSQFTGMENLNGNLNDIIKCNFYHDVVRFYIWFENSVNNIIYKEKSFDKISFIIDSVKVLELDYEDLVYNTLTINNNKGLGKGIYEIEWKNIVNYDPTSFIIELEDLALPNSNICFNIYAESYNYLQYDDGKCGILFAN